MLACWNEIAKKEYRTKNVQIFTVIAGAIAVVKWWSDVHLIGSTVETKYNWLSHCTTSAAPDAFSAVHHSIVALVPHCTRIVSNNCENDLTSRIYERRISAVYSVHGYTKIQLNKCDKMGNLCINFIAFSIWNTIDLSSKIDRIGWTKIVYA